MYYSGKCSLAVPCTNRPIKCTVCSMTVWSYSMAQHFEVKHTGMPLCALAIKPTALTYYLIMSWLAGQTCSQSKSSSTFTRRSL